MRGAVQYATRSTVLAQSLHLIHSREIETNDEAERGPVLFPGKATTPHTTARLAQPLPILSTFYRYSLQPNRTYGTCSIRFASTVHDRPVLGRCVL